MLSIGAHLKKLMREKGIKSIYALAQQINLPAPSLSKIIKYDATPRHVTLKKLADFFDVPITELSEIARKPVKPINPLADTLNHLMQTHYYNQCDLQRLSGVAHQVINKISGGKAKNPRPETLKKLADSFGITTEQLTGKKPLPAKYRSSGNLMDKPE